MLLINTKCEYLAKLMLILWFTTISSVPTIVSILSQTGSSCSVTTWSLPVWITAVVLEDSQKIQLACTMLSPVGLPILHLCYVSCTGSQFISWCNSKIVIIFKALHGADPSYLQDCLFLRVSANPSKAVKMELLQTFRV